MIEHIEGLFSSKISLIKEILGLMVLEAKMAKLNSSTLLIYLILTLPLLFTIWLITMFLLGYLLLTLINNQLLATVLIILVLNITLLIMALFKIKKTYQLMCFKKTRNSLSLI